MIRFVVFFLAFLVHVAFVCGSLALVVATQYGDVEGFIDPSTNSRQFLGIPFAAPPLGNFRWQSPQAPPRWNTTKPTTSYAPGCLGFVVPGVQFSYNISEDCLYLNVFTPVHNNSHVDDTPNGLPVLVWIHGGGFISGWTGDYPMGNFVNTQQVIVVSIAYRLSVFGFLALSELLLQNETAPPNFGLQDQQMALGWVQDNIAAFGGDPTRVTLWGESAGGGSIAFHLLNENVWPYYSGAILESPGLWIYPNVSTMLQLSSAFLSTANCSQGLNNTLDCLRDDWVPSATQLGLPLFAAFVPSVTASEHQPLALIQQGNFAHVPVLLGTNAYEGNLWSWLAFGLPSTAVSNASFEDAASSLNVQFPDLLSYYSTMQQEFGNWACYALMNADYLIDCGSLAFGQFLADAGVPVYRYLYTHVATDWALSVLNATHMMEIPFVMNISRLEPFPPLEFNGTEPQFIARLQTYWANMARQGSPNGHSVTYWQPYTKDAQHALVLDGDGGSNYVYLQRPTCAFWQKYLH